MSNLHLLYPINWSLLREQLTYQADWRREKAGEYPHDAARNTEAARRLENIRDGLSALPPEMKRELERLAATDPSSLWEEWDLQIGTRLPILPPASAEELVSAVLKHCNR